MNIMTELISATAHVKIWTIRFRTGSEIELIAIFHSPIKRFSSESSISSLLYLKIYLYQQSRTCSHIPPILTLQSEKSTAWQNDTKIGSCHKNLLCSVVQLLYAEPLNPTQTNQGTYLYVLTQLSYPKIQVIRPIWIDTIFNVIKS